MFELHLLALLLQVSPVPTPLDRSLEHGSHTELANLHFGDADGDGLDDVYVIRRGSADALLLNLGDGRFHDASASMELDVLPSAASVVWSDFDCDGRLDLLRLGVGQGRLLLQTTRGVFLDATATSGLPAELDVFARVLDLDRDGMPDVHLVDALHERVLRNDGGGRFVPFEIEVVSRMSAALTQESDEATAERLATAAVADVRGGRDADVARSPSSPGAGDRAGTAGAVLPPYSPQRIGPYGALGGSVYCNPFIADAANPLLCIEASSVPTLGRLYPQTTNLNVSSTTGYVGVNTASPTARLHIEGGAIDTAIYAVTSLNTGRAIYAKNTAGGALNYAVFAEVAGANARALYGYASANSGTTRGVMGEVESQTGRGVFGYAKATTGANHGVFGRSDSSSGAGVEGSATSTIGSTFGVRGVASSTSGVGVEGVNDSTDLLAISVGVRGTASANNGIGVQGRAVATGGSGLGLGVEGISAQPGGRGVRGTVSDTTGINAGVEGISASPSGYGVVGQNTALTGWTYGVYGQTFSSNGRGVRGSALDSGSGVGVEGTASTPSGTGVLGRNTATTGNPVSVLGETTASGGFAVRGEAIGGLGGFGVAGVSEGTAGVGVAAEASGNDGIAIIADALGTGGVGVLTTGSEHGLDARASAFGGQAIRAEATGVNSWGGLFFGKLKGIEALAVGGSSAAIGVHAQTDGDAGVGIFAAGGGTGTYGVYGRAFGSFGTASYGEATSPTGVTFGVHGESKSPNGIGVLGEVASGGTGVGVKAVSSGGSGFALIADALGFDATGARGIATTSGGGTGVLGEGSLYGVHGASTATGSYGVRAEATGSAYGGVYATHAATTSTGSAVRAIGYGSPTLFSDGVSSTSTGPGSYAGLFTSTNSNAASRGVVAEATAPAVALAANGNFTASGTKSFAQPHPTDGSKEIRFVCLEGNESGTYFRGTSRTQNGVAVIEVPEEFRLVSISEHITVQLTERGPWRAWCESSTLETIIVRSERDVAFDYFVQGRRRGFENHQVVQANSSFLPRYRGEPFGEFLPAELRQVLVQNGTLNADFTPNEGYLNSLGVRLVESPRVRDAELIERDSMRAAQRAETDHRRAEGEREREQADEVREREFNADALRRPRAALDADGPR